MRPPWRGPAPILMDLSVAAETTAAGHRARQVVDTNYMNGVKFDSLAELTVWAIPDSQKIRVRVRRAAVPTWFARIFGVGAVAVGARAAAVADYSDRNHLREADCRAGPVAGRRSCQRQQTWERYDPGETWLYNSAPLPDTYNPAHYAGDGTGTGLGSDLRNTYAYERDWGCGSYSVPASAPGIPSNPVRVLSRVTSATPRGSGACGGPTRTRTCQPGSRGATWPRCGSTPRLA